jgi:hypothetical protein
MRERWEQDKAFKGCHQPKKPKEINKAKGVKKTETKNTPAKASLTSASPKKTKRVWRVKGASSESSTPRPNESKINWANGGVPLTDSKLRALTVW